MNSKYFFLYKPVGITPLESIKIFKTENDHFENTKFAYAGRLDPMARGMLLILKDDETKNRDSYQNLDKEYIFKVILGVRTDTGDILGKVETRNLQLGTRKNQLGIVGNKESNVRENFKLVPNSKFQIPNHQFLVPSSQLLSKFSNKDFLWEYPAYSSKAVEGKPLFWWARNNKLAQIQIPQKKIKVHSLEFIHSMLYGKDTLKKLITNRINKLQGDFRQQEILESWNSFFRSTNINSFICLKFKAKVSSGTYIRTLAEKIGNELGIEAVVFDIFRTKVFLG